MVSEIPQYLRQLSNISSFTPVQVDNSSGDLLRGVSAGFKQYSDGIQEASRRSEELRVNVMMQTSLNDIYHKHRNDPGALRESLQSYKNGFLKQINDPIIAQEYGAKWDIETIGYIDKATNNYTGLLSDEMKANSLSDYHVTLDTFKNIAPQIFSTIPEHRQAAINMMMNKYNDLQKNLSQVNPITGEMVYGPEKSVAKMIEAKDAMLSEVTRSWFESQENKLESLEQLRTLGFNFNLPNFDGVDTLEYLDFESLSSAMFMQESGGQQFDKKGAPLTSSAGAIGVGQIMPETAPEAAKLAGVPFDEVRYRTDAEYNKRLAKAYLNQQIKEFDGNKTLALMAYNAGAGAVKDFMNGTNKTGKNRNKIRIGDPRTGEVSLQEFVNKFPFDETRNYVNSIASNVGMQPVNPMDAMSIDGYNRIVGKLESEYKSQLSIEASEAKKKERMDQQVADETYAMQLGALQDANQNLTLSEIDAHKDTYLNGGRIKEYLALRETVISGEPAAEDGSIKNQLMRMAATGEDVNDLALSAIQAGKLKWETYNQLQTMRSDVAGPASNTLGFYSRQLNTALADVQDPDKNQFVAEAQIRLNEMYQQKTQELGRPPTTKEMREDYLTILQSYNINSQYNIVAGKPVYITASELFDSNGGAQMNPETALDKILEKYPDPVTREDNPDFIQDMKWWRDYQDKYGLFSGGSKSLEQMAGGNQ